MLKAKTHTFRIDLFILTQKYKTSKIFRGKINTKTVKGQQISQRSAKIDRKRER